MPGLLIAGTRQAYGVDPLRAGAIMALPYMSWLVLVSLTVGRQVQHLL